MNIRIMSKCGVCVCWFLFDYVDLVVSFLSNALPFWHTSMSIPCRSVCPFNQMKQLSATFDLQHLHTCSLPVHACCFFPCSLLFFLDLNAESWRFSNEIDLYAMKTRIVLHVSCWFECILSGTKWTLNCPHWNTQTRRERETERKKKLSTRQSNIKAYVCQYSCARRVQIREVCFFHQVVLLDLRTCRWFFLFRLPLVTQMSF